MTIRISLRVGLFVAVQVIGQAFFAAEQIVAADPDTSRTDTADEPQIGARGRVGCLANPKKASRLSITKPGVYENYRIDGGWAEKNLVKITGDNVTLKNCEIFNGKHNAIVVYAKDVVIDSCRIHHLLKGTFKNQQDAHGISGQPTRLTIRNCEIYATSGDSVQFDPSRGPWNDVTIENCTFWASPLAKSAAGFRVGERPGENALDTKQLKKNPQSRVTIRNCYFWGWGQGQIKNMAALNIKENVFVTVENCVLRSNDICFRLRGDTGARGGATVRVKDCAIYNSLVGVRMEDKIEDLRIEGLAIGDDVKQPYQTAKGIGPGYVNKGQTVARPYEDVIKHGVAAERAAASNKK